MDQFLLNSNKRCKSENKQATLSTSGKSVKKCKNRKYDDSYLDFGFTSIEVNGEERAQCVLCMKFWHQITCYQVETPFRNRSSQCS
jgi:tRNA U34 5-methylaminomethyl-2-thiouridine-forming methyltransferase MnmC